MRVVYLKIPSKLHKFAKDIGLLSEVVLYYQMKIVKSNGFFRYTEVKQELLEKGIVNTKSSFYYKINKLLTAGLLVKKRTGYQLISYDSLFEKLGYSMWYNKKRRRKGIFKIHRIKETNIQRVRNWIEYVDIRECLKKQRICLYKSARKTKAHSVPLNHYTESTCREYFDELFNKDSVELYNSYTEDLDGFIYHQVSSNSGEYRRNLHYDITLSLKGVCRILGLTNVSCARNTLIRLEESGFLEINKRLIPSNTNYSNIYYKIINGVKYANLPNKLVYTI